MDWGLGHTTRCFPIIDHLLREGHQVFAAAEGGAAGLLARSFPGLYMLDLKGYRVRYSKHRYGFMGKLFAQLPKILRAIGNERQWLELQQSKHRFDLIISDNRYGLNVAGSTCILLTHQLQIRTGWGAWPDSLLRKLHYRWLERFSACWVVDVKGTGNLAGYLSQPDRLPGRCQYIGWLSQLSLYQEPRPAGPVAGPYILALLSGPEPMRSQLETLLVRQMRSLKGYRFLVVAGRTETGPGPVSEGNVTYYGHASGRQLYDLILNAELVICRSGYSTLMDLALLGKKALLVPTPGQTEQEYLARYLARRQGYQHRKQHRLDLSQDLPLALAMASPTAPAEAYGSLFVKSLAPLLASLREKANERATNKG